MVKLIDKLFCIVIYLILAIGIHYFLQIPIASNWIIVGAAIALLVVNF